ncbi:MAG: NAD(P)H-quinone oxidoreductase, partial [Candidatus Nanopelagicales bacterium]
MHAITQPDGVGSYESLQWHEVPDPVAGPGEVIVDIAATAVNRADVLQRQGRYDPPPGATSIIGLECAGVISELGPGVMSLKVGDRVTALLAGGGYAQRVAVPAEQVMSVPASITLVEAASLPEVACTVWSNVFMTAGLKQGEWLLIHGGGSGIGTHAIQVARAAGARIAVTAGSAAKLEVCRALGADLLIDYSTEDFAEVIEREIGGVDVILDMIGAKYLARNVNVLNRNGRIAIIGMQGGTKGEIDLGDLLRRNGTIHAAALRSRPVSEKARICRAVELNIWPWVDAGLVKPVIGAQLPIAQAG